MSDEQSPEYRLGEVASTYAEPAAPRISTPAEVYEMFRFLTRRRQEHFCVLLLTTKNHVLAKKVVSVGSLSASLVHPRDVFFLAIKANAASVVLVHNHPSGLPEPSPEDSEFTRRMVRAGELLGIKVLDHVVVAKGGYVSLQERGVM